MCLSIHGSTKHFGLSVAIATQYSLCGFIKHGIEVCGQTYNTHIDNVLVSCGAFAIDFYIVFIMTLWYFLSPTSNNNPKPLTLLKPYWSMHVYICLLQKSSYNAGGCQFWDKHSLSSFWKKVLKVLTQQIFYFLFILLHMRNTAMYVLII